MGFLDKLLADGRKAVDAELLREICRRLDTIAVGGILTGAEIERQATAGEIVISGFDPANLNPNSYNLSTGDSFTVYRNPKIFDLKHPETFQETETLPIPPDGLVLRPGRLYLVPTKEIIGSNKYVPLITGRSSIGRIGQSIHQEAGFGDVGFTGHWTLQIKVTYPVRIYPDLPIAQVYFITPVGDIRDLYHGKYQDATTELASKWGMDR